MAFGYTPSNRAAEELTHSDFFYAECVRIQAALNLGQNYDTITSEMASIGNAAAETTIQGQLYFPKTGTIVACKVFAAAITGTTDPTIDLYDEIITTPATVLTGNVTVDAAKVSYDIHAVLDTGNDTVTAGDVLGLRVVTAADGTLVNGIVAALVKYDLGA